LSASKLSLALEGGKLIVGGVVVVAAVKDVGETGCKLYLFVELIGELGVEQHYVFEIVFGQFVAVMLSADRPLPFAVRYERQAQFVLHC